MARNRKKKGSLNFQLKKLLDSKLAIGESKFEDKKENLTFNKIYSWSTYRAYIQHGTYFLNWAKEKYDCTDIATAKEYVNEWLQSREEQGLSTYTIKLETSAMMKIYNIDKDNIYKSKARLRANIKRSRGEKVRDKHFSEKNNQELVRFCRATGLRRAELSQIRGNDLIFINDNPYLKVTRNTKGGRERVVPLIIDQQFVVDLLKTKGAEKVFEKIPNSADIHGYRAEFATTLYKKLEKDISILPKEKKYYCRKDLKGIVYDKDAMLEVSRALGHNRIDVIAGHYIRKE